MSLYLLGQLGHVVFLASLTLHCLLGLSLVWIIVQHLRHRRAGLAREARLLAIPLPADADLPHVLIQIPTYNEGSLVLRIAASVGRLDWPTDRLHVQILDDSTDDSLGFAEEAVAALRGLGIEANALHRGDRAGFKAGALAAGLERSDQAFVAILDADYLPPRDFLRVCMRPLLSDDGLALVQARCDYLNADDNMITRAQQRILDSHFAVEQAARCWSNQILPFNGTCGIWRREAIDEAGGWEGDTLAEDLDLSYRAQLLGWRALFLFTVTVPGELPPNFKSWQTQQFRWTKGFAEVARKILPSVWRSRIPLRQKLVSTMHLSGGVFGPLIGVTLVSGAIDFIFGDGVTWLAVALFFLADFEATGSVVVMMLLGQRVARNASLFREIPKVPMTLWLVQYVALANLRATIEALLGRGSAFVRTPKGQVPEN